MGTITLEQFFKVFITFHAIGGFISLVAGTVSVIAIKGNKWHKKSGMVFYWGMMVAGISGIVASLIPNHINPFLFVVGLFSVYLVLSGYRALQFKRVTKKSELLWDKILAWLMLVVATSMITYGSIAIARGSTMGTVLIVFGCIGAGNALLDMRAFKDLKTLRKKYLRLHIGKISGGYIAAFTAFFVTNQVLPALLSWLLPSLFGFLFIGYWLRKTKPRKRTTVG